MKYGIGLDIGIASAGWAVVGVDQQENPYGIIELGARIFDAAENPKNGAPLAQSRRLARSARRTLRRHRHRLERIKYLLVTSGLLSQTDLEHLFEGKLGNIYELRTMALDFQVGNKELSRILLHLARRRGFKSTRILDSTEKQKGLLLSAVNENYKRLATKHYRTVGEMFFKDKLFQHRKRNKDGNYLSTVHRDLVEDEARKILARQQELGNSKITSGFITKYLEILLSQRQFDEGPGVPSPYAGNQIKRMIGKCTFEPGEYRAAKACYSFEYFNLLCRLNSLRLIHTREEGEELPLDADQRKKLIALAFNQSKLNYLDLRRTLGLDETIRFSTFCSNADDVKEIEKKTKFNFLPEYHKIREALNSISQNHIDSFSPETLDSIGEILTCYKGDDRRRQELYALNLSEAEIDALFPVSTSKFCHLSLKALHKIIPYLESGMKYPDACKAAGYDFRAHENIEKTFLLPASTKALQVITNPVVRRSISQTIKVINAIIRKQQQSPLYINIELAREISKNFEERKKISDTFKEIHTNNEKIKMMIKENFHILHPSGIELNKFKLWQEQDGRSPYSQRTIEYKRLFEPGYAEIDHIIPYSISFDDKYSNKVLVLAEENQNKGKSLPIQYLQNHMGPAAVNKFIVFVKNNYKDFIKRQNLLKQQLTEKDIKRFKERNLQDTKYISRFMYNFINDHLQFCSSSTGKKKRVTAVNGSITAFLRKRWRIYKLRTEGDKHHAADATVIACTTDKLIQRITDFCTNNENGYSKKSPKIRESKRLPLPWLEFSQELMARLSDNPAKALNSYNAAFYKNFDLTQIKPIFISRMPRRKVTGAANLETARSSRILDQGYVISKKPLTILKLDKNGEIRGYYNPGTDRILYAALKDRLLQFNNDAKKAFAEPFYKPKSDGSRGNLVRKVKIIEKTTLNVPVLQHTAVAENGKMVRVDVFKVDGDGYYLVPIYVADTIKEKLPNKAIVQGKPYTEWKEMQDKDFLFSLYHNDLVKLTHKKFLEFQKINKEGTLPEKFQTKEIFAYFKSAAITNGSIKVITNDTSYFIGSLGVKTLENFEKYQVDVLGNYSKVKKEIRQSFHLGTR